MYTMSKSIETVQQCREYSIGFNSNPSIKFLVSQGIEWRRGNSNNKRYLRSKPIYEWIETHIEKGELETQVVQKL
ncbi:hypothetical protein BC833DRAFT_607715, partial [Globomyces pollinis-pini]